jgi:hypothetical protein
MGTIAPLSMLDRPLPLIGNVTYVRGLLVFGFIEVTGSTEIQE